MAFAPVPDPVPEAVDPFAALDALEELAGPAPEQAASLAGAAPQKNIQGALMREARAMVISKGAKPSAEAREVLQNLKSNPAAFDMLKGASASTAAAPSTDPQPAAAPILQSSPPVAPLQSSAAPLPAPPAAAQPAARTAMTYHNPSAESWDSDDETESPKRGLLTNQACPPVAPQLSSAPLAATPPRTATQGWIQPAAAAAAAYSAPTQQGGIASTGGTDNASGWDSDDEVVPQQVVPPTTAHHLASGVQPGAESSGWDSDDEPAAKTQHARAHARHPGDNCGAPRPAAQAFVTAKQHPAASSTKPSSGDDLDDLVGEVLAADTTVSRSNASHGLVPGFQCTACDFQVLRIDNCIWGNGVEYMFFRNNYPNVQKLRPQLIARRDCCAYCCQCSWKSAERAASLADVAEGLRWRSVGL